MKRGWGARWVGIGLAVATIAAVLGTTVPVAAAEPRSETARAEPRRRCVAPCRARRALLRRLDRQLRGVVAGATGRSASTRCRRRSASARRGEYVPGPMLAGEPTLERRPADDGHVPDQPRGGVERRRADHVEGLRVPLEADHHRQGHLGHHRLRQDHRGRHHRPEDRGRHVQRAVRRVEGPVRRLLLPASRATCSTARTAARR